jgi:hypothetical protein
VRTHRLSWRRRTKLRLHLGGGCGGRSNNFRLELGPPHAELSPDDIQGDKNRHDDDHEQAVEEPAAALVVRRVRLF